MHKLRGALFAAGLTVSVLSASSALAGVVFTDDFNAEHGGTSALNYASFAKWTVLAGDNVDLVANGDYGTHGAGSYVDLDGTSGPGQIYTKQLFSFSAGERVTINFDLSGSQRSSDVDDFYAGLYDINPLGNGRTNTVLTLYGVTYHPVDASGLQTLGTIFNLPGTAPWTHASLSFDVTNAGQGVFYFGTHSADDVGPMIDNVSIAIGVPEPASWALMIGGFGLAGAALRRRRSALAA